MPPRASFCTIVPTEGDSMHMPTSEIETNDRLLDFGQVAAILGLSPDTVRRMANSDPRFPAIVYVRPRRPRFRLSEIEAYIEQLPATSKLACQL